MENPLGFGHFLANADGIARFILFLMLVMSVDTWYLIVTKGLHSIRSQRRTAAFLKAFWAADSLDAVARHLRQTGVTEPFSHLVHHGFTAVEQHRFGRDGHKGRGLVDAGTPDEFEATPAPPLETFWEAVALAVRDLGIDLTRGEAREQQ